MKPLVSIIIPVYNGGNYLSEAIDSALNQTYENIEIIVVNDGSQDDLKTEQIALSYGERITYVSKENGGSSSALNVGIRTMKGEYFSWLSHDDLYLPEKIEKQVEVMLEIGSENVIVVCSGMLIDKDGNKLLSKTKKTEGLQSADRALTMLSHGQGINGCGVLIPKALMDRVGGFDEKMVYLNDLDYWWRIILQNIKVFYMKDKLVKTRIHDQQVSKTKKHIFDKERHVLANKLLNMLENTEMVSMDALEQVAYFCAVENLKDECARALNMFSKNKIGARIKLYAVWTVGLAKRFLRWIRKKVLFKR